MQCYKTDSTFPVLLLRAAACRLTNKEAVVGQLVLLCLQAKLDVLIFFHTYDVFVYSNASTRILTYSFVYPPQLRSTSSGRRMNMYSVCEQ